MVVLERNKGSMAKFKVPSMEELLAAGVHFGHQVRRGNPKISEYIFGAREGIHIIDLAKTEEKLKEAADAAYELGKKGEVMLLLGTKKQARQIIEDLAKEVGAPYLTVKWIGGLLTNFDEIRKNIEKLNHLREEQEKGELSRYTKKEQLLIAKKLTKFNIEVGGIAGLEKIPDAIFIIDAPSEQTAIKEAIKKGVLAFGFCDTNANPGWFDYPIPANDDGIKSIKIISEAVIRAYGEGKQELRVIRMKTEKQAEKEKEELAKEVKEQAEAIEEEVEKKVLKESERKVG